MFDLVFLIRPPVNRPSRIFKSPIRNIGSSIPDPAIISVTDNTLYTRYQIPNLELEPYVRVVLPVPFHLPKVREFSWPGNPYHHEVMDTSTFVWILTRVSHVKHNARVSQGVRWLELHFSQYEKAEIVIIYIMLLDSGSDVSATRGFLVVFFIAL